MPRKLFKIIFVLLCVIFALASCADTENVGNPDAVTVDGLVYAPFNEEKSEYELIKLNDGREELAVPAEIEGKPVVSIGSSALYNNTTLRKVILPDSIVKIDDYAFDNCASLEEIVFSPNVESIGFNAFSDCIKLKEIKLPESLKTIESSAFARCEALEKIYVNPHLETIEKDSFLNCHSISEIHVSDISAWCEISFENIEANPLSSAERLYISEELIENLTITGIETISKYAFFGFSGIKTLTLGEGVSVVDNSAFSSCPSLTRLTLSDSVKKLGTSAFNSCSALEYVVIGKGVAYFSGLAFYGCESIYAVEITDLAAWCEAFFYTDSTGTANPIIQADVIIINGKEINELVIPNGVKKISTLAFIGFKGTKVTLPPSLRVIEDTAFYMCDNLTELHFNGTIAELSLLSIGDNNFAKINKISYEK